MKQLSKPRIIPCFKRWLRHGFAAFASMHRYVTIGVLSVSMSIILNATSYAQSAYPAENIDRTALFDTLVVSGQRLSATRSIMSQTTLFDRSNAAATESSTLESILRLSPAVDIRERGGKSVQTDIGIRGGSPDQTMVMLNGIDFTDARTGHQTHSLPVDVDVIGGIDLVDGVAGGGGLSGALNFRTQPVRDQYLRLNIAGGDKGYAYTNLSGATTVGRLSVFGAGSIRRSDGYRANTDFANYNLYARATYVAKHAGTFDFQGGYQNRSFGANGFYSLKFPNQFEQTSTALGSLRWNKSVGNFTMSAAAWYRKNFDRFELIRRSESKVPFNYHNTDNAGVRFNIDYAWIAGTTSLNGDYTFNHIFSTVLGDTLSRPRPIDGSNNRSYIKGKSRNTGNVYLRHVKNFRKFDLGLSAGVSLSPYGTTPLWNVSAGYRPIESLRIEIGAAQSMRLPTFNDLYYTATGYIGNTSLKPEQAVTARINVAFRLKGWNASLTGFYRDGRNIIDWVKKDADSPWQSMQLTRLGTAGVEVGGGYSSDGWLRNVQFCYGYTHSDKRSKGMISKYALDYMRNKASLAFTAGFLKSFEAGFTASVYDRSGNYMDATGATLAYKPYFLLNAKLSYTYKWLKVYIEAENITCTEYFDYGGLPMPKIWGTMGAIFTF